MKLGRVVVDTSVVSYILKNNPLAPWYSDLLRGRLVGLPVGHPQPSTLPERHRARSPDGSGRIAGHPPAQPGGRSSTTILTLSATATPFRRAGSKRASRTAR